MNNFGSRGQALIQKDPFGFCPSAVGYLLKRITCVVVSQKEQFCFPFLSPPCLYFLLCGSETFFILTVGLVYKLNLANIFVFCPLSKWNSSAEIRWVIQPCVARDCGSGGRGFVGLVKPPL